MFTIWTIQHHLNRVSSETEYIFNKVSNFGEDRFLNFTFSVPFVRECNGVYVGEITARECYIVKFFQGEESTVIFPDEGGSLSYVDSSKVRFLV